LRFAVSIQYRLGEKKNKSVFRGKMRYRDCWWCCCGVLPREKEECWKLGVSGEDALFILIMW